MKDGHQHSKRRHSIGKEFVLLGISHRQGAKACNLIALCVSIARSSQTQMVIDEFLKDYCGSRKKWLPPITLGVVKP